MGRPADRPSCAPNDDFLAQLEQLYSIDDPGCLAESLSACVHVPDVECPSHQLEGVASTGLRHGGNAVLLVGCDESWDLLGRLHGVLHRQAVLRWSDETPADLSRCDIDSLTLVGPPERFDDDLLRRIMVFTGSSDDPYSEVRIPWGILTARNTVAAFRLILRNARARLNPGPPRRILLTHAEPLSQAPEVPPPDLTIINQQEAFVADLAAALAEPTDLLSIVAHGRDDLLWIKRGLICGRSTMEAEADRINSGLPSCAYTGECYRPDRTLLDASRLSATVVFLNTCSALKLNESIYPTTYNVGLRVLDGRACAVIASPFMTNGKLWQNLLFHFLAGSGIGIGEALRVVNNATAASGLDFPGTVLLGDPLLTLTPSRQPSPEVTSGDMWRVDTNGANFVKLSIPVKSAPWAGRLSVAPENDRFSHPASVYYAYDRNKASGHTDVYLFSVDALPRTLRFSVIPGDPSAELRELATETTVGLQGAEWLGIRDQKLDRLTSELRNALRSLKDAVQQQRCSLQAAAVVRRRTRRFHALRQHAETIILDWLIDRTYRDGMQFYEMYKRGYGVGGWQWGPARCRQCGRPVVQFRASSHLADGYDRNVRLCSTCGIVMDGDGQLDLWVEGDSSLCGTAAKTLFACAKNNSDHRLTGCLDATPVNGAMYCFSVLDSRHRFSLDPGETTEFSFRIRAGEKTPSHHYWLRCYAVSGGLIYAGTHNIWVKP